MKLASIVLTALLAGVGMLAAPTFVAADEQKEDKQSLMQVIEDYVVANERWARGSFYIEAYPYGEGGFSVIKKNTPIFPGLGGDENSFHIKVDLKTRKVIGAYAYQ
jgi:hypothetical protein